MEPSISGCKTPSGKTVSSPGISGPTEVAVEKKGNPRAENLLTKKNLARLLDQRFTSSKALEKPDHTPCLLVRLGE